MSFERDRRFESISLQRGVMCEPVFSKLWRSLHASFFDGSRSSAAGALSPIVIAALLNPLKPSIAAMRCFTPRVSCSIRLFTFFDERQIPVPQCQ